MPALRVATRCWFVLWALGTAATGVAADWPMWRYDAGHTAASPHELPAELHLQWTRQYAPRTPVWDDPLNRDMMPYDRIFEPVVAGGRMYVGFNDSDKVVALDAATGREIWRFYTDGPVRFSPVAFEGKLYVAGDDGHLHCLDAADGSLRWRVRGGPSARKVLGNRRLISTWPARGGPVVRDGSVYFAASIWPFMGTFIYAVDAESGQIEWVNDSTGADFIKQPHAAPAFAGVAPQGQLVAAGELLLVPGGRSCPAAFDRRSGEFRYFDFGAKGQGGSFVAADDSRYFVHTRVRGTVSFHLKDGKAAGFQVNEPVLADGLVYAANTPGEKDGQPEPAVVQAFNEKNLVQWQVVADASGDLIQAGGRLYAAGRDAIVAIDPPRGEAKAAVAWSIPVEGEVLRLLAADEKLFAVTLDGRIMAFGAGAAQPATLRDEIRPGALSDEAIQRAERLLELAGTREGYALWYGVDDEPLLAAVLARSELHVVAVNGDGAKVERLRRSFDKAGLYGHRVAVHQGDPLGFDAPPYLAELIVVGRSMQGELRAGRSLRSIYESLRPYGGKLWIPVSRDEAGPLAATLREAGLPKAEVAAVEGGVLVVREGALPGAADWTHAYGDAANTVKSDDRRVKLPLGLLWFGGNSNLDVLPRHGHGPSQQVLGGRLFIQGIDCLSARDVYTGRVLWKREFENLGTFDVYYDKTYAETPLSTAYNQVHIPGANARGTNYVAAEEGVYLVIDSGCLLLDPATGQTLREFQLPADERGEPPPWGFVGVHENLLLAGVGFGDYSTRLGYEYTPTGKRGPAWSPDRSSSLGLLAFDRRSGKALWKVDARHGFLHNGIVAGGGRIYCLDKLPKRVEEQNKRRGAADAPAYRVVALDAATGKPLWSLSEDVFGSWLSYSEEHDVLLLAGAAATDRSPDEVGKGIAAYRGADGSLIWKKPDLSYAGPCMIHNDTIITNSTSYKESQGAFHLLDGSPVTIPHPITGGDFVWRFVRTYGCNTAVASEHMLTFRSGAAGFYDLVTHAGTGNLGGFKSGCSSNLIVANGVLNAPEYTRTCTCAYQNQTSLALVPMPENDIWTYNLFGSVADESPRIGRIGLNFAAPGDRRAENGTLWIDYPSVGGSSPEVTLDIEGEPRWFRRHSSGVSGAGPAWVAASGVEGARSITLRMILEPDGKAEPNDSAERLPARPYTVRLHFVEPHADCAPGQRVFDVALQDKRVLERLDVVREAGGANRSIVRGFQGVPVAGQLRIRLDPSAAREPVLCGLELIEETP